MFKLQHTYSVICIIIVSFDQPSKIFFSVFNGHFALDVNSSNSFSHFVALNSLITWLPYSSLSVSFTSASHLFIFTCSPLF